MVTRTRVLLWDMPTMMHDIILQLLVRESDFQIAAPADKTSTLLDASKKYKPDIVVTSFGQDGAHIICRDLLLECPRLKVLDVRSDGRKGYLYELRAERKRLGEVSPESLVTTIREAVLRRLLENKCNSRTGNSREQYSFFSLLLD